MIKCSMCEKQDHHYTENRSTTIGCYQFKFPLERKYVCDKCIKLYIDNLEKMDRSKRWWPFEIKR